MSELARLAVLGAVVIAIWAWFQVRERRSFETTGLQPGITVVTAPSCVICPETVSALERSGSAQLNLVDASETNVTHLDIQAAPTVIVADAEGNEILRRSGRSTVSDADLIVATARKFAVSV